MTAALQRKLPLTDASLCTLLDIGGVRAELPGHDEDDVLALIEDGYIGVAFDIGLQARREIRVWRKAVEFFKTTGGSRRMPVEWPVVIREILCGYDKPVIPGTRVKLLLNCSSTHVINLVEDRQLLLQPGTSWDVGRGNTPQITLTSFKDALKHWRIK